MRKLTRAVLELFVITALLTLFTQSSYCQEIESNAAKVTPDSVIITSLIDSTLIPGYRNIELNLPEATRYIRKWYRTENMWNDRNDPLRLAMGRLLYEVTNDPLYRTEQFLNSYRWEKIRIPSDNFFEWDTIHIMVSYDMQKGRRGELSVTGNDTIVSPDPTAIPAIVFNDSLAIAHLADSLAPDLEIAGERRAMLIDSILLVVSDTLREVISTDSSFPFRYYNYPMIGDSIHAAMDVLLREVDIRDSSLVVLKGSDNYAPVWLTNEPGDLVRLWLRNEWGEDVSVWIGSASGDTLDVLVERGVHFRRFNKETNIAQAQIDVKQPDSKTLADARRIVFTPKYWKFMSEAAFTFNQAMIKNWSKGGESNIAFTLDLQGTADYTNRAKKISWNSVGRFKFGYMASGERGDASRIDVRKNVDQIDIASKFNNKAFGKFDFSGTLIFKTQIARGYAYPNDSVVISKFFNPASITLGFGLDYKPNKNTSINFAPLSYKGTFVPDTAHIDQTKHGLLAGQRSRHEPGLSAQLDHKVTLYKNITVINKVRLFTNYIHNPLNVDIDWEVIATAKLNWFTDIRLNTHLIYDDDTLIPVYNNDGTPVTAVDGKQKKVPMVQFKEIIGLSVIFRF